MTNNPAATATLDRRVQDDIKTDSEQRESTLGSWITIVCVLVLGTGALAIEWSNISLALKQLLPTLSDGSGFEDVTPTIAFATVGGIVFGAVLLEKSSEHWSQRARRHLDFLGLASLLLFALSAMILLPASIWQGNDLSGSDGENPAASFWAYLSFALMLASLLPISTLANFTLFCWFKPAFAKVVRSRLIDQRIAHKRALLGERGKLKAELRKAELQEAVILSDAELADTFAAETSATINEPVSTLNAVIVAREAADAGTGLEPVVATDDVFLNHLPIASLTAHLDHLRGFSRDAILKLLRKED